LIRSLFISKDKEELEELLSFCKTNSIHLIAESLIKFKPVPFKINKPNDVIFFGSVRAAEFYLKQEKITSSVLIACIGLTTAKKLEQKGLTVSFVGDKSGNPESVAKEFKLWLGNRSVLIPLSAISNRSISSQLDESSFEEVVVYDTISDCKSIESCDAYVFTSPSNYSAFLECNTKPNGRIIAWGETTRISIEQSNQEVTKTLEYSSIEELIAYLK